MFEDQHGEAPNHLCLARIRTSPGARRRAQGWWTFQICHLDEIKQWHEDNGVVQKDASWSIGKIDVPKDLGAFKVHETTGQAALVQHDFDGGQMCHEIKQPRSGPSACAECPLPSALAPI